MSHHPLVSPWMLHEGSGVRGTAERLRELARLLGGVEASIGATLGSAATALGWEGQVTHRADEASTTTRTMLTRLADGCEAAGTALMELAGAMSWHGPRLVELLNDGSGPGLTPRFGSPGGPGPIFGAEPRDPVIGLPVQPVDGAGHAGGSSMMASTGQPDAPGLTVGPWREVLPIDDRERLILQHVEDLEMHDQRCHDRLHRIRDDLDAMFPHGTDPQFLRSLVPSEVWRQLVAAGVIRHTLPIRGDDRRLIVRPVIGPIRHTLPIRPTRPVHRELIPGSIRVVGPPLRHTLPIREDRSGLAAAEVGVGPRTTVQPPADR